MVGLLLAVAVGVADGDKGVADPVPAPVDVESGGDEGPGEIGATIEFYWAPKVEAPVPVVETPAPAVPVETPAPVVETPAPMVETPAPTGFHSEVEIFRVAASARGRGEAQRLLDATVAKLVAKGVDRSRIETDVSIGPRKVRIQIVKVKNVVRDPEGSTR
jgi:hypothetical protein